MICPSSRNPSGRSGKAIASANAVHHALQAKAVLLPDESLGSYEGALNSWLTALSPGTAAEADLVADGLGLVPVRSQRHRAGRAADARQQPVARVAVEVEVAVRRVIDHPAGGAVATRPS